MLLNILYALTIIIIPYSIIVICYIKISKYLNYHQHCLSVVSRRVQTDLNRILLAQAVVPIIFVILPLGTHLLSAITDWNLTFATFISGILYCWIPVGNATSILLFITAYRAKFKQLFIPVRAPLSRVISVSATVSVGPR